VPASTNLTALALSGQVFICLYRLWRLSIVCIAQLWLERIHIRATGCVKSRTVSRTYGYPVLLNVMKLCSLSVIVCVVYGAILADVLEYMVQNRGLQPLLKRY
jgi:hypothetical protein